MWGSALVSEGGLRPQNALTGSGPTWKQSAHGITVVWKAISGVAIVRYKFTFHWYIVCSLAEQRMRFLHYLIKDEVVSLELKPKARPLN